MKAIGKIFVAWLISLSLLIPNVSSAEQYERVFPVGTGYIASESGYIVTNKHVAEVLVGKRSYITIGNGDSLFKAKLVYIAKDKDVAILKVPLKNSGCLKVTNVQLVEGTRFTSIFYSRLNGEYFEEARLSQVTSAIIEIKPVITMADSRFVHKDVARTDPFIRSGNSGTPMLDPNTYDVIGLFFGSVEIAGTAVKSLAMQPARIIDTIQESGAPVTCTQSSQNPENTIVKIYMGVEV